MLSDAEVRARNIQISRAAAGRLTGYGWTPDRGPTQWTEPPDMTINVTRKWPYVAYVLRGGNRRVLYVGYTGDIYGRLGAHLKNAEKTGVCSMDLYGCYSKGEAEDLESRLIEYFNPPLNKRAGKRS